MEECIQVKIELGHKANLRAKKTPDGFTHDWTLFVRGSEGSNIQHFVERVVFHLHESFPKPKRVVRDPPYQISESGYAGFMMKIEVNFRNKEEPKRVVFDYDLYLQLDGPPISKLRVEKLTFNNPTEDFKRKVFQAGGVGILGSEGGLNPLQKPSPSSNSHCSSQSKPAKHVSEAIKAPKSSTIPAASGPSINTTQSITKEIKSTPVLQPPQTFVDLFGQPIKASKASPDPQKAKDLHSKNTPKSNKPSAVSLFTNEQTSCNSNSTKDSKSNLSKEIKDPKDSKKEKSAIKRVLSPLLPTIDSLHTKKRKIVPPNSSSKLKDGKDKKKSEKKSSSKDKEKKEKREKHKHSTDGGEMKHSTGEQKILEMKSGKDMDINSKILKKSKHPPSTSPSLSSSSTSSETKSSRSFQVSPLSPQLVEESPEAGCVSPSSSISLSPMHHGRGHGPLDALMAAYEDGSILSPMSSDSSSSPPHTLQEEEQMVPDIHMQQSNPLPQSPPSPPNLPPPVVLEKIEKPKVKEENVSLSKDKVKKSRSKGDKLPSSPASKKVCKMSAKEHVSHESTPESISDEYATELKELQRQIMTLRDRQHLQQIVNVIEETGLYKVTSTTFDFDLCRLDRGTVIKLQNCLAAVL